MCGPLFCESRRRSGLPSLAEQEDWVPGKLGTIEGLAIGPHLWSYDPVVSRKRLSGVYPPRRTFLISVGVVTAAGAVFRLLSADESLAWDELFMLTWVHNRSLGTALNFVQEQEKTPPFGFLLAWLVDRAGGPSNAIRLPSLVAGVALIPMSAVLASRAWRDATGVATAALVAFSPFLVFYSVEARSYSLVAALVLASTIFLLRAVDSGKRSNWAAYGLVSALAITTHYIAALALFGQWVWVLAVHPRLRREAIWAQVPVVAAVGICSPLIAEQFGHAAKYLSRMAEVAPLSASTVGRITGQALIGQPFAFLTEVPGWPGLILILSGLVGGFGIWLSGLRKVHRPRVTALLSSEKGLFLILAVSTPVLLIGVSLIPGQSILMTRNLIPSVPFALIFFASILSAGTGWKGVLPVILVVSGMALGLLKSASDYQRPQFNAAAEAVLSRHRPGEPIVELCCLAGQEGLPGIAIATYLPRGVKFRDFKWFTSGGAEAIAKARRNGTPFFLIWRDGSKGSLESPARTLAVGSRSIWEERWPGFVWVGAGEYR